MTKNIKGNPKVLIFKNHRLLVQTTLEISYIKIILLIY